jgi:hypothetical protein
MRRIGALIVSLIVFPLAARAQSRLSGAPDRTQVPQAAIPSDGAAIIQVAYYAKPGKADEVFRHRQHVSDLLEKMGLPPGRVMRRTSGSSEGPDVMWECEYPDAVVLDQALKSAQANAEFEQARQYMSTLILKGERRDWEVPGSGRQAR